MRGDTTPVEASSAKAGELTDLFQRERVPMLRLATLLVGSAHVAEELVQDSFEAVERRWTEIERPGAYLRTAVVNGCRETLRRREVEQRHRSLDISAHENDLPTRLVELKHALDVLTDRQRVVIVLRYFADVPDAEVAELLDCRPSTVRSLNRRALLALRKELE